MIKDEKQKALARRRNRQDWTKRGDRIVGALGTMFDGSAAEFQNSFFGGTKKQIPKKGHAKYRSIAERKRSRKHR